MAFSAEQKTSLYGYCHECKDYMEHEVLDDEWMRCFECLSVTIIPED